MAAMKVKPEHIEALRTALRPFLNKDTARVYADAGLSPTRYRWDALWSARKLRGEDVGDLITEIYQYANDTHIDTVLKMLAEERKDVELPNQPV